MKRSQVQLPAIAFHITSMGKLFTLVHLSSSLTKQYFWYCRPMFWYGSEGGDRPTFQLGRLLLECKD